MGGYGPRHTLVKGGIPAGLPDHPLAGSPHQHGAFRHDQGRKFPQDPQVFFISLPKSNSGVKADPFRNNPILLRLLLPFLEKGENSIKSRLEQLRSTVSRSSF